MALHITVILPIIFSCDLDPKYNNRVGIPGVNTDFQNVLDRDLFAYKLQRRLRACDRCSMAFSKELRVPFLSPSLVRFASRIPFAYKIRRGQHRSFFVDALDKIEHNSIKPSLRNKRHVVDPQRQWLFIDLKEFVLDTISPEKIEACTSLSSDQITSYLSTLYSQEHPPNNSVFLQMLCLSSWIQEFF